MHRDELRNRDLETLSRVASHAMAGLFQSVVATEPELLEQEEFKQEVVTLLCSYLCG